MSDLDTMRPEVRDALEVIAGEAVCTCHEAYTSRGMKDPACNHDLKGYVDTIRAELLRLARECDKQTHKVIEWHDKHDKLQAELADVSRAIGSTEWMDPPDGGDVSVAEQVARMKAELATARETIKRLNRRVQVAEAGVAEKVKAGTPGSLGRALANAAADKYLRERDKARAELAALKARIAEPVDRSHEYVQSKEHGGCSECGYPEWEPWHRVALVKVEDNEPTGEHADSIEAWAARKVGD